MPWFFAPLAQVVAIMAVVVMPVLGFRRYRQLSDPATTPERRRRLLVASILRKWCLVLPVLVLWAYAPEAVSWTGEGGQWWVTPLLIASVAVGAVIILIRRRDPERRRRLIRSAAAFSALLPRTTSERPLFILFAITAGITEEILYRGFLIPYLAWAMNAPNWLGPAILAGMIFGLLHVYQGWRGVLMTGVLGMAFGVLYLSIGLLALMVVHTLLDLRVLLIPVGAAEPDDGSEHTAAIAPIPR
jgi:uncharacterized protein